MIVVQVLGVAWIVLCCGTAIYAMVEFIKNAKKDV
jgi:hypothetical protein|tara:strand:+ start:331 stop:435 length:105 start_codon:yes stop_codon:yes gene_type:complete